MLSVDDNKYQATTQSPDCHHLVVSGCELASQSNAARPRRAMGAQDRRRACNELISFSLGFLSLERVESRVNTSRTHTHTQNHNEELLKDSSRLVLCITKHTLQCWCMREKERVTDYIQSSSELIARKSYQSKSLIKAIRTQREREREDRHNRQEAGSLQK